MKKESSRYHRREHYYGPEDTSVDVEVLPGPPGGLQTAAGEGLITDSPVWLGGVAACWTGRGGGAGLRGEVVPAVQDGLLAEGGEALPVGGHPRLHQPLAGAGQAGGVLHLLRGNYFAPDILPFIFNKVL